MSSAFLNTPDGVRVGALEAAAQDEAETVAVAMTLMVALEEAPELASSVAEDLLAMDNVADAGTVLGALAVDSAAAASSVVAATIVELDDPQAAADLGVEAARSTEAVQAVTDAFEQLDPATFETVVQHLPPDVVAPHDSPEPGEQGCVITFETGDPTSGMFGSGDLLISLGGTLSPAPIDRILTRYAQAFPQARVVVRDVVQLPAGVPSLPSGSILNSMMEMSLEGFDNQDVVAAHTTLFIEKQWLDANQVHQWSLQFNRFDDERDAWRPAPAKRVREDAERVYFSVVIPGFSLWAITGSVNVPEVVFFVDELTITPTEAVEGEPVTIGVMVTNLTSSETEYNASLWLNSRVDTVRLVPIGANETVQVTFTVEPEDGSYHVRMDRLRGSLVVQKAPAPAAPVIEEVVSTPVPPAIPVPAAAPVVEERGVGLIVGIIVGGLAIAIAAIIAVVFLRGREPSSPAPLAAPPEETGSPETPAEEPSARIEGESAEESGDDGEAAEQQPPGDENEPGRG